MKRYFKLIFPLVRLAQFINFSIEESWRIFKRLNRGYWERIGGTKKVPWKNIPKVELISLPAYSLLALAYYALTVTYLCLVLFYPWIWLSNIIDDSFLGFLISFGGFLCWLYLLGECGNRSPMDPWD